VLREPVDDVLPDAPLMGYPRFRQPGQAGVGQHRERPARIVRAGPTLDQAFALQPVDEPSDTAAAEQDALGELAHPQRPPRSLGELDEDVVAGERQLLLGLQLDAELAGDLGMGDEEGAPRAHRDRVEPARDRRRVAGWATRLVQDSSLIRHNSRVSRRGARVRRGRIVTVRQPCLRVPRGSPPRLHKPVAPLDG